MRVTVVTGSRADYGLLEWPIKTMKEDPYFQVEVLKLWGFSHSKAFDRVTEIDRPDLLMVLGDRFEILGAATAAHLLRIPIAHIGGGDVTEGSYDDAMRDCISRMASIHFVTSSSAMARLTQANCKNIHLVGSPGIDYIKHADWKKNRPIQDPYVVVSYQAETIDGGNDIYEIIQSVKNRNPIFILPNPDRGNDVIREAMCDTGFRCYTFLPHDEFLNMIYHAEEFIGNSSAMLYEAPELRIKTRMIGKRQRGRTIPWGDGNASERIIHALKYGAL
jgi:UDP-N-acetylglucosamine 2-epimerase (non-hydrolysing)/GDP/UDP-N,N'-diacetylbacillosamine 2-epimerase (hydrolysing)